MIRLEKKLSNTNLFLLAGLVIYLSAGHAYSQRIPPTHPINDSLVYLEMSFFTISGATIHKDLPNPKLKEIRLYYSDSTIASLIKSNWISIHRLIHISFTPFDSLKHTITFDQSTHCLSTIDGKPFWGVSTQIPTRQIVDITYFHVKGRHGIPESALEGIYEPPMYFCKTKKDRKKRQPYFRAYMSEDNWRMYIYMLGGSGKDRYEVTWVMNGHDYYGRFINRVHE